MNTGICEPWEYLLNTYCYTVCPRLFYAANVTVDSLVTNGTTRYNVTVPTCLRCDSSCLYCNGPAVDQCTSCSAFHALTFDNRCVESSTTSVWHDWRVPLIISIVALSLVVLLTPFVVWLTISRWREQHGTIYQPVDEDTDCSDEESTSPFLTSEEKPEFVRSTLPALVTWFWKSHRFLIRLVNSYGVENWTALGGGEEHSCTAVRSASFADVFYSRKNEIVYVFICTIISWSFPCLRGRRQNVNKFIWNFALFINMNVALVWSSDCGRYYVIAVGHSPV